MNVRLHIPQNTQTDGGVEELISHQGLPGGDMNSHFVVALLQRLCFRHAKTFQTMMDSLWCGNIQTPTSLYVNCKHRNRELLSHPHSTHKTNWLENVFIHSLYSHYNLHVMRLGPLEAKVESKLQDSWVIKGFFCKASVNMPFKPCLAALMWSSNICSSACMLELRIWHSGKNSTKALAESENIKSQFQV